MCACAFVHPTIYIKDARMHSTILWNAQFFDEVHGMIYVSDDAELFSKEGLGKHYCPNHPNQHIYIGLDGWTEMPRKWYNQKASAICSNRLTDLHQSVRRFSSTAEWIKTLVTRHLSCYRIDYQSVMRVMSGWRVVTSEKLLITLVCG